MSDEEIRYDGFLIKTMGHRLFLYAREGKGLLYAVSHLAEQHLGVRFYTPEAVVIPRHNGFCLPQTDTVCNPSFAFRDVLYYYPNHSQAYADFHGLHNNRDLHSSWGMFVHTFQLLIPPARYFDQHPEWFSETEGRRLRDGQLCLSNPEMLDELCRNLDSLMRLRPEAQIWSVSNNDNYNVCTCPRCRHLDSLYGGPSGTLVYFINQVADRFPNKTISTLGYQFTRQAPQSQIRPRPNVNIMFCSIECGRQEAIATANGEAQFRKDIEQWAEKTDNIFLWDYVGCFRNFWMPFPNLHVLQPNLQFFHNHGVRLMFEQGTGADNKTAWMELRTYLIAKLLWNVDADVDSLTRDFCQGYYGPAAQPMMQLYAHMHQSLIQSGQWLNIYGYPTDAREGYLSPSQIRHYQSLVADAYRRVGSDSLLRDRIRYFELSLDFAILELSMAEVSPDLSFSAHIDQMSALQERFVSDCQRFGISMMMEMGISPQEYRAHTQRYIQKIQPNLAQGRPVQLTHNSDSRYWAGGAQGLTDGMAGQLNYQERWLGFYGQPLEAIIDLGSRKKIHEVRADFFFFPLSWIFAPQTLEVYLSNNRRSWHRAGCLSGANPQSLALPDIQTYQFGDLRAKARYVKLVAQPLPAIPDWHRAAGKASWIFCDEIIIH